jgi:hypothetical protein
MPYKTIPVYWTPFVRHSVNGIINRVITKKHMGKNYKVAPEVKEQIINRIKNEGVSINQAANDHGISSRCIYHWLGSGVSNPSYGEISKLKKENKALMELVGEMTLRLSESKKKN